MHRNFSLGYTTVFSLARAGSAVSEEAQTLRRAMAAIVRSVERSQALFGGKAATISAIWALAAECAESSWDGGGADALDRLAALAAAEFIRALPDGLPLPEVAPEPDGAISLDWIQSRDRLFSVSVATSGRLAFAWLAGSERGHGVARFDGEQVPHRILDGIADVALHEAAQVAQQADSLRPGKA